MPSDALGARPLFGEALAAAARLERDRRGESYPGRVAAGVIGEQDATLDYQAWCAIAQWLETGRTTIVGNPGGADHCRDDAPIVTWGLLTDAAGRALASLDAAVAKHPDDADRKVRRDRLFCIHCAVSRQAERIAAINADLKAAAAARRPQARPQPSQTEQAA